MQIGKNVTVQTGSHYAVEDQDGNFFAFTVSENVVDLYNKQLQVIKRLFIQQFCVTDVHGSGIPGVNVQISQGKAVLFSFQSTESCMENEGPSAAEFDTSKRYSIAITDPLQRYLSVSYIVYADQINVLQFSPQLQTVLPKQMLFSFYEVGTQAPVSDLSVLLQQQSGSAWRTYSYGTTNESGVF